MGQGGARTPTGRGRDTSLGTCLREPRQDRRIAHGRRVGLVRVWLEDVTRAVRLLADRSRVVAEGAGATAVAAALSGSIDAKSIGFVVSGGNIDSDFLAPILRGDNPEQGAPIWMQSNTSR